MSKSPITIDAADVGEPSEWLHNPHAGEMIESEFLEPLMMSVDELAEHINVDGARIADVISGRKRIDAELDLRLSRYFRMTAGFFLGLQTDFELFEAKRALVGKLDHIIPRAA